MTLFLSNTASTNLQQKPFMRAKQELTTAPTKNWRFSASYDSFVVQQTFVLCINIWSKNRQLLVAAKRYA